MWMWGGGRCSCFGIRGLERWGTSDLRSLCSDIEFQNSKLEGGRILAARKECCQKTFLLRLGRWLAVWGFVEL